MFRRQFDVAGLPSDIARQVDDSLYPTGPPRHHNNPVAEVHGLFDRMRDEEHCVVLFAMQPLNLLLQNGPRLRV